ncbi:DUF6807 family protein [Rhodopirellula sp. MGV]|uniref:DUF6807 family protein n=1 Tax=Rhodopirellula sp. MGV TaxID=2023130 RepID=UPI000B96B8CE|nr:DUF6807 family protein [Rhodopirellula sp. MGV]OYP37268.1 hypothetical protein CGZ80_05730 [Rhodopirellula sp. MGV]PNY38059.1 hypothetical protein C2E31_04700 [Rhodopirellula baltica]
MSKMAVQLQLKEGKVFVSSGDQPICEYQQATTPRDGAHPCANYIHPLFDFSGNPLTEDFPADHLHHRGVFWAWHQLQVDETPIGDGWMIERFRWEVTKSETLHQADGTAALNVAVDWKSEDFQNGVVPVVREQTSMKFYPDQADLRQIDFDIRLVATQPNTRIGGSDDDKGYGGFSLRIKMPEDLTFESQNGIQRPAYATVPASPWLTFRGRFNGEKASSVTLLTHPQSAGYPQPWILRSKRSMQNPVWPGQTPVALSTDQPTRLRYRLLVHRDTAESDQIEHWHRSYLADADAAVV